MSPRRRTWVEVATAIVASLSALVTIAVPAWIEVIFRVDPDGGGGGLEVAIVGVLVGIAILASIAARGEWLRVQTPAR